MAHIHWQLGGVNFGAYHNWILIFCLNITCVDCHIAPTLRYNTTVTDPPITSTIAMMVAERQVK